MRRLERWLHEHVFKVGWLVTKKSRTTTLLYYTFFLPGVFLHEFVRWLVAGILDVRAERAIKVPDEQQIAELKLTFVRLHRSTGEFKLALISAAPLLVGLAIIYYVSQNILRVPLALAALGTGGLTNIGEAIGILTAAPDVWLWVYFVFTIANTMIPSWSALKGWRVVLIALGVGAVVLLFLGVADDVFLDNLAQPIATAANVLTLTFAFVIGVDLLVTAVLGTIEAIVERVTGDSATFVNGRLVAMTRQERQRQQEQERQRQERQQKAAAKRTHTGPPSIYNFPFPIPKPPDKDASTVTVQRDFQNVLLSGDPADGDEAAADVDRA
ncbi:MAG: hypothetical protein SGJ24_00245 [Chloroflexota bacterium]|nr:hypothetical protein [Chloroflexota bacterium]